MSNRRPKSAWKPGQSGNPGGRPRISREVRELAQAHTVEAIETLVDVCRNGKSGSERVKAANAILDRAAGKPLSVEQIEQQIQREVGRLSDSEVIRIAKGIVDAHLVTDS